MPEINNSIPGFLARAFNKAVSLDENLYEDGSVNWNYVDADMYMSVGPRDSDGNPDGNAQYYAWFDALCEAYERANGIQKQQDTIVDCNKGIFSEYAEEGLNTI